MFKRLCTLTSFPTRRQATTKWSFFHDRISRSSNIRRKYSFDTKSSIGNRGSNSVLYALLLSNGLIYCAWEYSKNDGKMNRLMYKHFTLSSRGIANGNFHTAITSIFSHQDSMHLLSNMITLYFFGSEAIMLLGPSYFLALYLGGGIASSLVFLAWPYCAPKNWESSRTSSMYRSALGASGAVNSVIAWSIIKNPTQLIYLYMVIPIPAAVAGCAFIGYDVWGLYKGDTNVAHEGHLGGIAFGVLASLLSRGRYNISRFR